jgi:hypothetical protein
MLVALIPSIGAAQAETGTEVGGILTGNTTWTTADSPYNITETVQIPETVILTIEPGVVVTTSLDESDEFLFKLHGKLIAQGTETNKIVFDGGSEATTTMSTLSYGSSFFSTAGASGSPQLILDNCVIKNGNRLYWGTVGHFNLTHSELTNLGATYWGYNGDSQIYYPGQTVYIEHNLFINTTGFSIGHADAQIFIRYNVFKNNRHSCVWSTENSGLSKVVINYNSFIDVDGNVLRLSVLGDNVVLDAINNYWGTTNLSLIEPLILDGNDDISIHGLITYEPVLAEPHPVSRSLPITVDFVPPVQTPYVAENILFNASSCSAEYSNIVSYSWNFGDENTTTLSDPMINHVYTAAGHFDVELTVTDNYGFQTTKTLPLTVLADNSPPITLHDYVDKWQTSDFTITLSAIDSQSGVFDTYYRINQGVEKSVSTDGQPQITVENANITLEFWSTDNAGNVETAQTLSGIKLDKTNPVIGTPVTTPETEIQENQDVTVSVDVSDAVSDVKNVVLFYSVDNKTTWEDLPMILNSTTGLWQANIPSQTIWTTVNYKISAVDNADNSATTETNLTYSYDVIPEFPSELILPLFFVVAVFSAIVRKKFLKG